MPSANPVRGFLLATMLLLGHGVASPAEPAACDPELRPPVDTPYAYRQRGAVCEGLYAKDVGGRPLAVVGVTGVVANFSVADDRDLLIDGPAGGGQMLNVRAESLRPRLYYRMDAKVTAATAPLHWSPRLLAALGLGRRELGLLAWTDERVAGELRRVHRTLTLHQAGAAPAQSPKSRPWQVVVLPINELDEIYYSVTPQNDEGVDGQALIAERPVRLSYYPPYQAIAIDLPASAPPGLYRIDVAASLRDGGSATDRVWVRKDGD